MNKVTNPAPATVESVMALADEWAFKHLQDDRDALSAAIEQIVYECAETRKEWRVQHDRAERAERERDAALALLKEARSHVETAAEAAEERGIDNGKARQCLARIDALLEGK